MMLTSADPVVPVARALVLVGLAIALPCVVRWLWTLWLGGEE